MSSLWRVIQSNMSLRLNSGMQLSFLILSPEHTKRLNKKYGKFPNIENKDNRHDASENIDYNFGCSQIKNRVKKGLFSLRMIQEMDTALAKSCLILAFVVNYFYRKKDKSFKIFYHLHSSNSHKKNRAKGFLTRKCNEMISPLKIEIQGPHNIGHLKELCDFYGAQVWCFAEFLRYKCIFMYPEKYNPKKMPLFFTMSEKEDIFHIDPVLDILSFFLNAKPCIQCLTYRTKYRSHTCRKKNIRKSCKYCKKISLQAGDFYNDTLRNLFCAKEINENISQICTFCNQHFKNILCYSLHLTVCKKRKICKECGKPYFIKKHECYTKLCMICHQRHRSDENHVCNVAMPKPPKSYNRIIIFDMETKLEESQTGFQLVPNLIIAFFERSYHESFSSIAFFDVGLKHNLNEVILEDILHKHYLPSEYNRKVCKEKMSTFFKGRSYEKQGPEMNLNNENNINITHYYIPFEKSLAQNCVYRFLRFFLRPYFRNSVMISHGGSRFDNIPIIAILLKFPSIKTEIIHSGNAAIMIKIVDLNITFVDFLRFCHESLANLCKQYELDVPKTFFPYRFNHNKNYNYVGQIPDFDTYWKENHDSENNLKKKRLFWEEKNLLKTWDFNQELYEYCYIDVQCLTIIVCNFAENSFIFQDKLISLYKLESQFPRLNRYHPYTNFFTLASFV